MKINSTAKKVVSFLRKPHSTIFTFGNGGSASIAEHMACDWMKGSNGAFRVISLSSNGPLLSAIGNDLGYENTCYSQLDWLCTGGEIVVLVSSSGTSANIVKAAKFCKSAGIRLIGFSGFSGGPLRELADLSVHLDSADYGEIEDFHSNVMHEVYRIMRGKI